MKKNLLSLVQSILSDMDSAEVNSISDSNEAQQVVSIIEDTYYSLINTRAWPEHQELLKLTAASDSDFPTHFSLDDDVKKIDCLWYENSDGRYVEILYLTPMEFLSLTDGASSNYTTVYDKNGGTKLRITNNQDPKYYTSFDDNWVILNSHKSAVEATLQESKVRAMGFVIPTFTRSDTFVPDIDATAFSLLASESKSTALSLLKGGSDPKVEQNARRQKSYIQNDKYRTEKGSHWPNYGR